MSNHDKRLQFVTSFTGTSGEACITDKLAALWTDSRYHIQAEQQIDKSVWSLMKEGNPNVPNVADWLCDVLPANSRVGINPELILASQYGELAEHLASCGHELISITFNLVHMVWNEQRPPQTFNALEPVEGLFSGLAFVITHSIT